MESLFITDDHIDYRAGIGFLVVIITAGILYLKSRKKMDLSKAILDDNYDYIVIGGGTAGCVVASRLSEDKSKRVLLLEAGPENPPLEGRVPLATGDLQLTDVDWQYKSTPGHKGRVSFWPRGKVLGGSSVLNNMLYVRGNRNDYDEWANTGCIGWSYNDVLPYFIKSEDYEKGSNKYRGKGGLLKVTTILEPRKATKMWIQAAIAAGYKATEDYNGEEQEGVGETQANIINGERHSEYMAFIKPFIDKRINLIVRTKVHVTRIIIKDKRAVGVEIQTESGEKKLIYANREIILSAGTVGSPHILMLSGIGPKDHLKEHNIECHADLPVGNNLQDHLFVSEPYASKSRIGFSILDDNIWNLLKWLIFRTGCLTSPVVEAMAFIRTRPSEKVPDCQLHFVPGALDDKSFRRFNLRGIPKILHGISTLSTLLRPKSIGTIRLNSANPFDHPIIQANYLTDKDDIRVLVEGLKSARRIHQQSPLKEVVEPIVLEGIPHPWDSDEYLTEFVKENSVTVYHPVGTCKMGAESDNTSVVNSKLQVKGIHGLRVVDASIMPSLIGGNTNAPTIMIAEKGSDLIKKDNMV